MTRKKKVDFNTAGDVPGQFRLKPEMTDESDWGALDAFLDTVYPPGREPPESLDAWLFPGLQNLMKEPPAQKQAATEPPTNTGISDEAAERVARAIVDFMGRYATKESAGQKTDALRKLLDGDDDLIAQIVKSAPAIEKQASDLRRRRKGAQSEPDDALSAFLRALGLG